MFCENCGVPCKDGAKFCHNCGAQIRVPAPEPEQPMQTEVPTPEPEQPMQTEVPTPESERPIPTEVPTPEPDQAGQTEVLTPETVPVYEPETDNRANVLALIKRLASSPIMLTVAILSTVSVVLSFLSSIGASAFLGGIVDIIENAFAEQGIDVGAIYGEDFFTQFTEIFSSIILSSAIVTSVPAILTCVGYWITNATARGNFSTAGLTIIKVLQTIRLVFAYISSALYAFYLFLFAVGFSAVEAMAGGEIPDMVMLIVALVLLMLIAAIIINIVYITKIRTTLKTVIETAKTGVAKLKGISVFVAVMFILTAVCQIPAMLTIVLPISALLAMVNAAYFICLAVMIFKYRSEMKKL